MAEAARTEASGPTGLEKRLRQAAGRVVRRVRRLALRPLVRRHLAGRLDTVEVIMVLRDRYDERIVRALRRIREQRYPRDRIGITVVDYDSRPERVAGLGALCREYGARCIRVEDQPVWCKSHGLNIAIRRTDATYTLSSDVDVLLEPGYVEEAVEAVRREPFRVVFGAFLDLPERSPGLDDLDWDRLRAVAEPRFPPHYAAPIPFALTWFFRMIRGYDETYRYWGKEDDDLVKRFYMLGLDRHDLERSHLFHQWHPHHEGIDDETFAAQLARNTRYYHTTQSVRRNPDGWGEWQADEGPRGPGRRSG